MKEFTLLACDPGTSSFAYQVIQAKANNANGGFSFRILQRGFIFHTVKEMKGKAHQRQLQEFIAALRNLEDSHTLNGLIAERYMARGVSRSTVIETVNVMVGVMSTMFLHRPAKFIPASEWKNELHRAGFDLESIYLKAKEQKVTPHEIDSLCIGIYGLHKMLRMRGFQMLPQVLGCRQPEVGDALIRLLLAKPKQDYGNKKDRVKQKPKKSRRKRK